MFISYTLLTLVSTVCLSTALPAGPAPQATRDAKVKMLKRSPSSCSSKYLASSTMCQYHDNPAAKNAGVSSAEQTIIIDDHNKYRRLVRPTATNMQTTYWDAEIAAIAQKWAQTCPRGHDTNDNRKVPGYGIAIGQNWAGGFPDWSAAIKAWYDEVDKYQYGQNPDTYLSRGFAEIGHYTQVVRDVAARVGCGYAECPGMGKTYVCNYAFGNPLDWGKPYERGPTCSKCPKSCKRKLCDCQGVICLNGGTLNPNTCQCTCTDLWAGPNCGELSCPPRDPEVCGAPWGYEKRRCEEWTNVPDECPHMCGVCQGGSQSHDNAVLQPNPKGQKDKAISKNKGINQGGAAVSDCTTPDPDYCGQPQPRGFLPEHCRMWTNVPDECPAMCGRCQALCPGKTSGHCKNGGTLNKNCGCDCDSQHTGDVCEKSVACPRREDEFWCTQFSKSDCDKYYNFPTDCPYMCAAC